MAITFESLPALVNTMQQSLTTLCEEVQQLRSQQPVNESPIDSKELMARLAISEPTLIRMRKRKAIPFLEVCGHYRYIWQDVLKALANNKKAR